MNICHNVTYLINCKYSPNIVYENFGAPDKATVTPLTGLKIKR